MCIRDSIEGAHAHVPGSGYGHAVPNVAALVVGTTGVGAGANGIAVVGDHTIHRVDRQCGAGDSAGRWYRGAVADAPVSYTHLRAHETVLDLVCRLLLEKNNKTEWYNRPCQ